MKQYYETCTLTYDMRKNYHAHSSLSIPTEPELVQPIKELVTAESSLEPATFPRFHFKFETKYGDNEFIPNPEIESLIDNLLTISPIQITTSIQQAVSCGISTEPNMENIRLTTHDDDFPATARKYYEDFLSNAGLTEALNLRQKFRAVNSNGIQNSYFCQLVPFKNHESAFRDYFDQGGKNDATATAIIENTATGNTTIMLFKKNFFEQGVQARGNGGLWMLSLPTQIANDLAIPALKKDPLQFSTIIMAKLVQQYSSTHPDADQNELKKLWNSCDFYTKSPKHHLFVYHQTSAKDDNDGGYYSNKPTKVEEFVI